MEILEFLKLIEKIMSNEAIDSNWAINIRPVCIERGLEFKILFFDDEENIIDRIYDNIDIYEPFDFQKFLKIIKYAARDAHDKLIDIRDAHDTLQELVDGKKIRQ